MYSIGANAYKMTESSTVENKERILKMLYEGMFNFLNRARIGIQQKSSRIRGENISKVMAILTELDCALDREMGKDGEELVENLSGLYHYMMNRLTLVNLKNDTDALDEVERLLHELKDGFDEAAKKKSVCQPFVDDLQMQGGFRIAV